MSVHVPGGETYKLPNSANPFALLDLNEVGTNNQGETTYGGVPAVGAIIQSSYGVVPFPKDKKPVDPVPITHETRVISIENDDYYSYRFFVALKALFSMNNGFGLRLRHIGNGVFVSYVEECSPAAAAGIRFGDQVLLINTYPAANMKGKKAINFALSVNQEKVPFLIRDRCLSFLLLLPQSLSQCICYFRPLERVIELSKDTDGNVGACISDGTITTVQPKSDAERNGILNKTHICEVDGVNVVGLPDEDISDLIKKNGSDKVRLTLMPEHLYKKLTKRLFYAVLTPSKVNGVDFIFFCILGCADSISIVFIVECRRLGRKPKLFPLIY